MQVNGSVSGPCLRAPCQGCDRQSAENFAVTTGTPGITTSCVVVFAVVAGLVASHWPVLLAGDQAAEGALHGEVLAQHWLLVAARTATTLGSPVVVDAVTTVVVVMLLALRWWPAAVVALARVSELVCESVVKVLVARPRPVRVDPVASASGSGFPSGHAGGSAAGYGALVLVLAGLAGGARWARVMLVRGAALLIGAVAVSRVLLGVHYPSDVAAGVASGACLGERRRAAGRPAAQRPVPDFGLKSICPPQGLSNE